MVIPCTETKGKFSLTLHQLSSEEAAAVDCEASVGNQREAPTQSLQDSYLCLVNLFPGAVLLITGTAARFKA